MGQSCVSRPRGRRRFDVELAAQPLTESSGFVGGASLVTAGCEQPGTVYMQVLVDGAEIILSANGSAYRYTTDDSGVPRLCEHQG